MEPNGAPGTLLPTLETDYSHDALKNLLNVNQVGGPQDTGSRVRSFSYDGLSRLLCSSNPETSKCILSGGLLWIRRGNYGIHLRREWKRYIQDVAGSQHVQVGSGKTISISYSYDALNRLLSKTYTNDITNTPSSCFQYDVTSVTNGIGRLAYSWTQNGVCPTPVSLP